MRHKNILLIMLCSLWVAGAAGCRKKDDALDFARPLPPGAYALRKLDDSRMWPDLSAGFPDNRDRLVAAVDHSLSYLVDHPSSLKYYPIQGITHAMAVESLKAFREIVLSADSPPGLARRMFEHFDVYQSVGCDDRGTVLFTGYYTPILDGSLEPTDLYRHPLYRLPADLVKDDEGRCLGRRMPDGRITPYPARRELETGGALRGLELVYLKDKFDAYICHVQGSALIRLPDGRTFEVGYAGKNAAESEA